MLPTVVRRTIKLAGLEVPLVEATGSADGPVLTVIAGVHGCEYASMPGPRSWYPRTART
jgi:predicted deacylase